MEQEKQIFTNEQKKEIKKEFKEKIEKQTQNTEEMSKEEKINYFFNKIEFLSLNDEEKEKLALKMNENSKGDKIYYFAIIFSSLISTLGLLEDSVAVVIGAMIMAPLIKSINSIGFSIAKGGQKIFKNSFLTIFFSIIISIFLSFSITKILGLQIETTEIISRIEPNIIDFFIAIFSAIVGVLSLRFPKLGEGIAGVAIASALIPPLSVVGIEIAFGNYQSAIGAFTLFSTNLIPMVLISAIFFWLYGFTPHDLKLQTKSFKRFIIVILFILLILIPLILSFSDIRYGNRFGNNFERELNEIVLKSTKNYEISDIKVNTNFKKVVLITFTLKIPFGVDLENLEKNIEKGLKEKFNKKLKLNINIIRKMSLEIKN